MKRLALWAIVVAFVFALVSPVQAAAASSEVSITFNGEKVNLDVAAYVEDGRTLVPVRGVFEKLGLGVVWEQSTQTATIKSEDGVRIEMKLGQKAVQVNGESVTLDTTVTMKDNRLFIPVRFVSETAAGADVNWNQETQTVTITTGTTTDTEINEEVKAFLTEVSEVEINSFSTSMDIKQSMEMMGEEINAEMTLDMDMVLDPLGMYQAMAMTMEGFEGDMMKSESYFTEDGFFTYDSISDQWVKYDDTFTEDLLNLSNYQMDPAAQFELMAKFYQQVEVVENDDTYELHTTLAGEEFQELLTEIMDLSSLGLGEDLDAILATMDININKMEMVSILDKETLYPVSGSMSSDMTIGIEGETMSIVQEASFTYSNVNELEEIVIPQEVIDSAISIDELAY